MFSSTADGAFRWRNAAPNPSILLCLLMLVLVLTGISADALER